MNPAFTANRFAKRRQLDRYMLTSVNSVQSKKTPHIACLIFFLFFFYELAAKPSCDTKVGALPCLWLLGPVRNVVFNTMMLPWIQRKSCTGSLFNLSSHFVLVLHILACQNNKKRNWHALWTHSVSKKKSRCVCVSLAVLSLCCEFLVWLSHPCCRVSNCCLLFVFSLFAFCAPLFLTILWPCATGSAGGKSCSPCFLPPAAKCSRSVPSSTWIGLVCASFIVHHTHCRLFHLCSAETSTELFATKKDSLMQHQPLLVILWVTVISEGVLSPASFFLLLTSVLTPHAAAIANRFKRKVLKERNELIAVITTRPIWLSRWKSVNE